MSHFGSWDLLFQKYFSQQLKVYRSVLFLVVPQRLITVKVYMNVKKWFLTGHIGSVVER